MKFSQRIGKNPISKSLQIESMDDDLRNSLWNGVKLYLFDSIEKWAQQGESQYQLFCKNLWHKFYKLPFYNVPSDSESYIRAVYFKSEWFEVYEFIANLKLCLKIAGRSKFLFCVIGHAVHPLHYYRSLVSTAWV